MEQSYESAVVTGSAWLDAEDSLGGTTARFLGRPIKAAMDRLPDGINDKLTAALVSAFEATLSTTAKTTDSDAIRTALELELNALPSTVDSDVSLRIKHAQTFTRNTIGAAFAGGFGTGLAGPLGLVADIPILIGLQNRMALQVSAVYGHEPTHDTEKLLFFQLLDLADTFGAERRAQLQEMLMLTSLTNSKSIANRSAELMTAAMAKGIAPHLARDALQSILQRQVATYVAKQGARVATGTVITSQVVGAFVDYGLTEFVAKGLIRQNASRIGTWVAQKFAPRYAERLLARKAIAALPIIGGVIGGAFNAWYTNRNAETIRQFYSIRYLCEHHDAYDDFGLSAEPMDDVNAAVDEISLNQLIEHIREGEETPTNSSQ